MEWKELKGGFSMATVRNGEPVDVAMGEFCHEIRAKVIPLNKDVTWDYVRVEFWSDSGRMIVFPASTATNERIERAGCQVVFNDLLLDYERLADSEMEDETFSAAIVECERDWIDRFLTAAASEGLGGHRVQFWTADADQPIHEAQL